MPLLKLFYKKKRKAKLLWVLYCKQKAKKAKRNLTKFGKIFVGVYVILTVAVASTILAVNLGKGESVRTKANAGANDGISALAMEVESENGNWFDDVCDAVSNK